MNILIVDDEAMQRSLLGGFLKKQGHIIFEAATGGEALSSFAQHPIDLVLLDHRMPDMNGDQVLAQLKECTPLIPVIMITAYGAVDTAVQVMQLGAEDFLEKPVDLQVLLTKIQTIEDRLQVSQEAAQVAQTIESDTLPVKMIASSSAMQELLSMILRAAPTPWTVLIHGETGTGKELVAKLIHLLSPRKDNPFITLNCAAIPEGLFESELFGHEKGSFTGAINRRRGVFEQANKGTLLLDEAGELPLAVQAKLLRALQEQTIQRVGGEQAIKIDTRILAATNRDLKQMVAEGTFREDLYYRLNVITLEIPPLRRRKEEIPQLVQFFLEKYQSTAVFHDQAMAQLSKYYFPGNIRELEHILQRTITLARSPTIGVRELPEEIRQYQAKNMQEGDLNQRLAEMERRILLDALEQHQWVQTKAAQSLGISERVLRYKMERLAITNPKNSRSLST